MTGENEVEDLLDEEGPDHPLLNYIQYFTKPLS